MTKPLKWLRILNSKKNAFCVFITLVFIPLYFLTQNLLFIKIFGLIATALAAAYFFVIIDSTRMIYKSWTNREKLWCFVDVTFGIAMLIFSFASIYRCLGLAVSGGIKITQNQFDCLYFSAITWTTLGYGDLLPLGRLEQLAASAGPWSDMFRWRSLLQFSNVSFQKK